MSYTKKKILLNANIILESRYLKNKFILNEQDVNYIDKAKKKLKEFNTPFDLESYFKQTFVTDEDYLCTPKTGDEKKIQF